MTGEERKNWTHEGTLNIAGFAGESLASPLQQQEGNGASMTQDASDGAQVLHHYFEQQVRLSPGHVAAVCENQELTYERLNQRANRLAHYLIRAGAGPETQVGLCVERSLAMLVGIVGILKAGAAYLPLDPHYPSERLAFMLSDSQAGVLLIEEHLLPQLPATGAAVVFLDRDEEEFATESTENPDAKTLPENPAYLIYTSGSTGKPKGVVVTHSNAVRLFLETRHWFNFSQQDIWALFHSFAFDFSVWETWGALLHGGKVVVVPYFVSRNPEAFYELLGREQVTILNQTPSAFRQLIRAEEEAAERKNLSLRLVIFGGEALDLQSLKPWMDRHGDERPELINMFGITETTVHVTYRRILRQDMETKTGSVIGRPIPDLQIHVCGQSPNPCASGETGELYVGGAGLARGYLRRPELTAERFIPDPFSREPGARLYRTGDLARRLSGDDLEYLGRVDQQVKVRGFRIEPGEIEAILAQHPGVRECVVAAFDDEHDGKRLAAYVVPGHCRPALEDLHSYLRSKLPDYMLPAATVFLSQLPLTAHGKMDRSTLPPPEELAGIPAGSYAGPRTPAETLLADVWRESLGLSQVGMDDNYFALGGDSIRSIKVRAKALERGLRFSLQQLFENPTVRRLAAAISDGENTTAASTRPPAFSMISEEDRQKLPRSAEDAYPVSLLQSGMIFHSEYSPDYIVYVSSLHVRLNFDATKAQQALDYLAARHEMLRTCFDLEHFSMPVQIVHRAARLELCVEDLRHFSPDERQGRIDQWLRQETRRKFDWTQAPLFRFHAHLRGDDSVQFTMSEPFLDGWSVASLLTEFFESYFALHHLGVPRPLATSYNEFVALELEALRAEQCRNYWAKALHGSTASRLPRRTLRPPVGGPEVVRLNVPVSSETSDALKSIAKQAGVSLKSVLLAAHLKALSTLSGESEVFTGLLINGRPETTDGDRLIGAFLNTVPFRMRLGSETWIELARKTYEIENATLPFRRYPIQELQRLYQAEKKFDTIFNYTHFHVMDRLQRIPGLEVLEMRGSEQTYYPLTAQFTVNEFSGRAELALDYRTAELGAEQVQEIAGYYGRVLEAIAANPLLHHDTFCPLATGERQRLLAEFNQTPAPYSDNLCLHQVFASQAQKTPDANAVVFAGERLTYGELERRANQLARYLQQAKAGPETLVGICMERGISMIIGLLGILKAGSAYLPLDPQYPAERLAFMLEDTEATTVVTQEGLLSRIPGQATRRICIDSAWPRIALESSAPVASGVRPDNLAYVVYTSGSTGKPKGVLIQHGSVVNTIETSIRLFGVDVASRVAQLASLSFDASVLEIFMALLSGASLLPVGREVVMSGEKLGRFLLENAITTVAIPPSLLDLVSPGEYPALHSIVVGGEACSAGTAERWSSGRLFFNAYAPTEATIYATIMRCKERERQAPPIGRPIQNMQVYLLDQYQQPVPPGVLGELHIGGVGVARGYLHRPELTAERFVPDPFTLAPGGRLYKTGDLARFLSDGNIQFLGRTDQQVKVRGFRIELGEIESALGAHPLVREVAVVVREDDARDKRIVAYVVPHDNHVVPTTSDLRNHLKNSLPEYMLPAVFITLEAMPLSDTGKIDRALLPAPEYVRPELIQSYIAPRSALERVLAGVFSEVLKIEQVGIVDNFFELGGHSLVATQVISRIRELFAIDLPLKTLFEETTVSGLAHAILKEREPKRITRTAELLLQLSELSEEEASRMLHDSDAPAKEQAL